MEAETSIKYGSPWENGILFDSVDEVIESYMQNTRRQEIIKTDYIKVSRFIPVKKIRFLPGDILDSYFDSQVFDRIYHPSGAIFMIDKMWDLERKFFKDLMKEILPLCYKKTGKTIRINLYKWAREHGYEERTA